MMHKIRKHLIFQPKSSILSNLFLNFINLNFLYVNLVLNVPNKSKYFVDLTSFSSCNSSTWMKCQVIKLKLNLVGHYQDN
jgi:hypothetical protein